MRYVRITGAHVLKAKTVAKYVDIIENCPGDGSIILFTFNLFAMTIAKYGIASTTNLQ